MADPSTTQDYRTLLKDTLKALDDMQSRVRTLEREKGEPIAILGAGCRLPGGSDTPEQFWNLLREGRDAVTEVPPNRFDIDEYYDPDPDAPGKLYCRYGSFVSDVEHFDAQFFRIAPREAFVMDPQQRLLLETSWEALERSGISPGDLVGSKTGVFAGLSTNDYAETVARYLGTSGDAYIGTGNTDSVAVGRLSYLLGLNGPNLAVDTACSSSLVAIHLACQSLRSAECDTALAGGVNLILTPTVSINFCKARMLSADGSCKTFDAAANGYVRGEGAGMIVLKRLSDAERDGDPILAVIRSTAINQDGRSTGLTVPNGPAQSSLIKEAMAKAGLKPTDMDYIEAHGTGTSLGDPIELEALGAVFGRARREMDPVIVGSVKTNIGHLEAAAGIAGIIKTILALYNEEIPPHLHFQRPTPHVNWNDISLKVPTKRTPWPRGERTRRAGVSSFGFSGTNAHVILEEAPERPAKSNETAERPYHVITLSAKSQAGLDEAVATYEQAFKDRPDLDIGDACYTTAAGRMHFDYRLAVPVASRDEAIERLGNIRSGQTEHSAATNHLTSQGAGRVAFLCTGQGAQYPDMGRHLYETEPTFRKSMDSCNEILEEYLERPLIELLYGGVGADVLNQTANTQPALFALEYSLSQMWQSWGVRPAWTLGHSVGEFVAACLAGVFGLEDGLKLIATRGRLMQALPSGGTMVALGTSRDRVEPALSGYEDKVSLAAVNGPRQVVISGESESVEAVTKRIEAEGVRAIRLKVSHAFHSALMEPMLDEFAGVCESVEFGKPRIPLISTVTGRPAGTDMSNAEYWVNQIRSPVLFVDGIKALFNEKARIMLEVGPQPVLIGQGRQSVGDEQSVWLHSLRQSGDDWGQIAETLGHLFVHAVPVDFKAFDADYDRRIIDLPTYPFQRLRFWADMAVKDGEEIVADSTLGRKDLEKVAEELAESDDLSEQEKQMIPRLLSALATRAKEDVSVDRPAAGPDDAMLFDAFYEIDWNALDAEPAPAAVKHWIVIPDSNGVSQSVASALESEGHTVTTAQALDSETLKSTVESIDRESFGGILHFGYIDSPDFEGADADSLLESAEKQGGSLLAAIQALVPKSPEGVEPALSVTPVEEPIGKLWVVTRGAQSNDPEQSLNPAQSPAWGIGKVISLEHNEYWGGVIDVGEGSDVEIAAIVTEITTDSDEDQIVLRGDARFVPRLVPREFEDGHLDINSEGTYLVAGGTGGLGRNVAQWLVEHGARHLVLTSRRGPSTAAARKAVEDLESAGASVEVAKADVADFESMKAVFDKIADGDHPVRGVVHAAGITGATPIARMRVEELIELLGSKVAGGWVLDRLTTDVKLDFFVLFSSIASVWGSAGQAHYAAANQFLDALAHDRRARGLPATSINWGPWSGSSMATPEARVWLSRIGVAGLQPREALRAMELCLATDAVQRTVATVDWSQFTAVYEARTRRPFLEIISKSVAASSANRPKSAELIELESLSKDLQQKRVLEIVRSEVADALGFSSPSEADPRTGLFDMGMDSLSSVDLQKRLENRLGWKLPTTAAFDYPTIEKMAAYLCESALAQGPETQETQVQVKTQKVQTANEPIAIVGVGARLPGAGGDLGRFRESLMEGADLITEVPPERWDIDEYYDPNPDTPGKMYSRYGSFLTDVDKFDPKFFSITPREAFNMDPQQRMMLEICWEALESGGIPPSRIIGSKTGVFIGVTATEYSRILGMAMAASGEDMDPYFVSGNALNAIAGRISYVFELYGQSMSMDSACSSSLVSIHTACRSLRAGECDAAFAGGVNLTLLPEATLATCRARMLSADGACKSFDAAADGYVRGEGAGVVYLKRLSDAEADGDRIHAVIRGSAVNQDGRSSGLTVPNGVAQQSLLRESLSNAQLTPADVDYVEAHGSGTALGDPIELQALTEVFSRNSNGDSRPNDVWVASVKTNVGHLEAAAGIAGLIKVVLALQDGHIPPQVHFKKPTPHIDWDSAPLRVPTEPIEWQRNARPRVATISSFGFSGTNANLVIAEAPDHSPTDAEWSRPMQLVPISGKSSAALEALASEYHDFLEKHPDGDIADVAHTAGAGREHFDHRLAIPAASTQDVIASLAAVIEGELPAGSARSGSAGIKEEPVAFMFTGQGSQFTGMGRQLYDTQPVFRRAVDRCAELFAEQIDIPLLSLLYPEDADEAGSNGDAPINQTRYTQPALFTIEYALAKMWMDWGVEPAYAMGHSIGEFAAACIAGVFNLEDAVRLVAARGRLMQQLPEGGGMVALITDVDTVREAVTGLEETVAIAAINGPRQVVISGEKEALEGAVKPLEEKGIKAHRLVVSHAFHSPLMDPMLDEFKSVCESVTYAKPAFNVVSDVTGEIIDEEICTADYWCSHVRQAVQFVGSVETLVREGAKVFLEVGPKPTLVAMARQFVEDSGITWLSSLPNPKKRQDDWRAVLESLAELYVHGADIDFAAFDEGYGHTIIDLPTYRFQRQRYWPEGVTSFRPGVAAGGTGHAVLGRRLRLPQSKEIRFETAITTNQPALLDDHRLFGTVVVPGSNHIAAMLTAAEEIIGDTGYVIEDVFFPQALVMEDDAGAGYQIAAIPEERGGYHFQAISYESGEDGDSEEWKTHAQARLRRATDDETAAPKIGVDTTAFIEEAAAIVDGEEFYDMFWKAGYTLGPSFRWIDTIWRNGTIGLCKMKLPEVQEDLSTYILHPGLIDSCFQALAAYGKLTFAPKGNTLLIPFHVGRIQIFGRPKPGPLWMYGGLDSEGTEKSIGWMQVFDDDGNMIAVITGHESRLISRNALLASLQEDISEWQYETAWKDLPELQIEDAEESEGTEETATPAATSWLVFADEGGTGNAIIENLRERGDRVIQVKRGDSFETVSPDSYRLNPVLADDFSSLLDEVIGNPADGEPFESGIRSVLYLWNLDAHIETDASWDEVQSAIQTACAGSLYLLQAWSKRNDMRPPRWYLVTSGAQSIAGSSRPVNLAGAALWGMGSVMAVEQPELRSVRLDMDPDSSIEENASNIVLEAVAGSNSNEGQITYRGATRYGARLVRRRGGEGGLLEIPDDESYRLQLSEFGVLDNLEVRGSIRREPVEGEVEVEVECAGLNFRDVLRALGMLRDYERAIGIITASDAVFGLECAGRIVAVGEDVDEYEVGDEVVAITAGTMNTHITVPLQYVAPKPDNITAEEAAATSFTLMTAIRALEVGAELKAGERILIHAASGGVGQAAVRLAKHIGAEVHGTASPPKQDYLREIGVDYVYNSRTVDFADEIMEATGGEGVDVVLNSLNEEFIPKSLSVLKKGGRFIEMGAIGIWDEDQIHELRSDVYYERFDMLDDEVAEPGFLGRIMSESMNRLGSGDVGPIPFKTFSIAEAAEAFRFVAQAKHIGKVLVSMKQTESEDQEDDVRINGESTYLVTGGLGGLGREIARWLAEEGAKHLVLAGRSGAKSPEAQQMVTELTDAGVEVHVGKTDISDETSVTKLLEGVRKSMPPIKGIIHAAGILADGPLNDMTWEQFERVLAPKAAGAWHLHRQITEQLDFSVAFSSIASLFGSAAQGNYAAANGFLDGLAAHNMQRGLPGLSINWGPWSEAGMAANLSRKDRARWDASGIGMIANKQGMEVLSRLLPVRGRVGVVSIDWSRMLANLANVPFFAEMQSELGYAGGQKSEFLEKLEEAPAEQKREILTQHVVTEVSRVLGLNPEEELPLEIGLFELGLDSLTAVELRNRLQVSFGTVLPMTLIFNYPTLKAMIEFFADDVLELPRADGSGKAGTGSGGDTEAESTEDELEDVSTEDMAAMLKQRLTELDERDGGSDE